MLMIVVWHFIMHGNVLSNTTTPGANIVFEMLMSFLIVHVNSFVMITGYFQSKSHVKISKIIDLIVLVIFYTLTIMFVFMKFNILDFNKIDFFNAIMPSVIGQYWFVAMYLILYILSDYINIFLKSLNKRQLALFLILIFMVFSVSPFLNGFKVIHNNGFNFYHFIFMYILGAYLRLYPLYKELIFKKMTVNTYRAIMLLTFIILGIFNFLTQYFAININNSGNILSYISNILLLSKYSYANPFVIIQTISFFEFFSTLKIKSKIINYVAGSTLGVYLISDNNYVRRFLYYFLKVDGEKIDGYFIFIKIMILSILVFLICILIDIIRRIIVSQLKKSKIFNKINDLLLCFINSFGITFK